MPTLGVNVAAFQHGKILLTKREDFHVWCLPGGHVDPWESLAQAAVREMREETGLEVVLSRLIGLYSRPRWQNGIYHIAVFAGDITGGAEQPQEAEVVDLSFFGPDELPYAMMLGHRRRVLDAFSGERGVVRSENATWPFEASLLYEDLIRLRDLSGLAREEFYVHHIGVLDDGSELEVSPD